LCSHLIFLYIIGYKKFRGDPTTPSQNMWDHDPPTPGYAVDLPYDYNVLGLCAYENYAQPPSIFDAQQRPKKGQVKYTVYDTQGPICRRSEG